MWLGIDGGGSNLRVVVVDDAMQIVASATGESVNPNSVGRDIAAQRIRAGIASAIDGLQISGVGIGVAGASARHSADWLMDVVRTVLPDVPVFPSSDEEIALVGARGALNGVVLIAGTGSAAYGIHPSGETFRAGGWGYLLGDEGSGYWIGLQAAKALTLHADQRLDAKTNLPELVMTAAEITSADEMIRWVYGDFKPSKIATLARIVLEAASAGDAYAIEICQLAAKHLAELVRHVQHQLNLSTEHIVFAGGLLSEENPVSVQVLNDLGLTQFPITRYPPVIGAALLAKLRCHVN